MFKKKLGRCKILVIENPIDLGVPTEDFEIENTKEKTLLPLVVPEYSEVDLKPGVLQRKNTGKSTESSKITIGENFENLENPEKGQEGDFTPMPHLEKLLELVKNFKLWNR